MKLRAALAALTLWAGAAAAADYRLDADHTFVQFEVLHFGTSTLRGRFGPIAGSASFDAAAGSGRVALRIPVATLDTGLAVLDRRLREPDLFDTPAHPEAYYVAERFVFAAGALRELRGELTLRGVSRPLALHALRFGCRADPEAGRERCGGDFEAELKRSDFGLDFGLPLIADRVRLLVSVEGLRAD